MENDTKPVLMIHEVDDDLFNLDLEQYILTFDDGLYTQYKYIDRLVGINTTKIFFISTDIVCECNTLQNTDYISCVEAHDRYNKHDDRSYYMTWSQIQHIHSLPGCIIGGHSHYHFNFNNKQIPLSHIVQDTEDMMMEFLNNINDIPKYFCFPYNHSTPLYTQHLKRKGFTELYGTGRVMYEKYI